MKRKVKNRLLLIGLVSLVFFELLVWHEYCRSSAEYSSAIRGTAFANENYSWTPWAIKEGLPLIILMVSLFAGICVCLHSLFKDSKLVSSYFKFFDVDDNDPNIMLYIGMPIVIFLIIILALWSVFLQK